jgi:CheY-like chemotaxis protein
MGKEMRPARLFSINHQAVYTNRIWRCNMADILIVEDDAIIAEDLSNCIKDLGHNIISVEVTAERALTKIAQKKPQLILMDIKLSGALDGIEATSIINSRYKIPVIYITAFSDQKIRERVSKTMPLHYIIKPFDDDEVKRIITEALS